MNEASISGRFDSNRQPSANLSDELAYVSARELANLVKAAEAGYQGSVNDARDFLYVSNIDRTCNPAFASAGVGILANSATG